MYLSLENIGFSYPKSGKPTLQGFNLSIQKGDCIGLVGASGCGKSTLLRLIAGLEPLETGRITLDAQVLSAPKLSVPPEKRHIGMVFQNYCLFPHLSVRNNIAYGIRQRQHKKERVNEMLALIDMQAHADRYPYQLSGGQQQRVALARSLAPKPKIILMDEPFSNLDATLKQSVRQEVKAILQAENMTSIIVTHDLQDTEALCDDTVVLA
ncbi:MAG: ABC transporter ATP-binding protein [Vitreoscilla sp.]|nr:ABC transporter ATP-binding protein [Vitreoscilla sp.]